MKWHTLRYKYTEGLDNISRAWGSEEVLHKRELEERTHEENQTITRADVIRGLHHIDNPTH